MLWYQLEKRVLKEEDICEERVDENGLSQNCHKALLLTLESDDCRHPEQ